MSELSAEETVQAKRWRKAILGRETMQAGTQRCLGILCLWREVEGEGRERGDRVVRAGSRRAFFGPAKEFRFYHEGMREPLKEF